MIDFVSDDLIDLKAVPKLIKTPKKLHLSTIYRWQSQGVRGVKLETVMIGGKFFTTIAAVREFLQATSEASSKAKRESIRRGRLTAQRERDIESAENELSAMGI